MPLNSTASLCPRCAASLLAAPQTECSGSQDSNAPFTTPPLEELKPLFPQLEILEFLGRGGMGAVYKVRQKELDRIAALKILPPNIAEGSSFAERFSQEAKALARLNHPGIVTIYDFGKADGLFYLLMEFVDGTTLRRLLEGDRLSAREALTIVPQICDALQYAHDSGVVHRDIKPENILLDRRGRVKVADFGLAKLIGKALDPETQGTSASGSPLTHCGTVIGTPAYMAPEQKEHPGEVDHRADIYALGVVLYQMLTGELPTGSFVRPSRKVQVDVRLDDVVLQALAREPARRYQQVSEIKTAVEGIANQPETKSRSQAAPGRINLFQRFVPVVLTAFLTVMVLELSARALNLPGLHGFVSGFLAGGTALAVFMLAPRKPWLKLFLVGSVLTFLALLCVATLMTGAALVGLGALVLILGTSWFFRRDIEGEKGVSRVFAGVFVVIFGTASLLPFLLSDAYVGRVRLTLGSGQRETVVTQMEVIKSEAVSRQVVSNLQLTAKWGKRYTKGGVLSEQEALQLLQRCIQVGVVPGTRLIEICAWSPSGVEAAQIANEFATAYRRYVEQAAASGGDGMRVEIIDTALPSPRPARPNRPLNLALGALAGWILASMAAGLKAARKI
jgi:serine/threonine protein kinase/capsular polysaccharide biosynthesis protein